MKFNYRTIWLVMALVIASANGYAHKGATGIVKQRMDSMSEMKDAMKSMADMVKGKSEINPEGIANAADVLSEHASKLIDFFPDTDESRNGMESDALPAIWTSWDRFEKLSNNLKEASGSLKQASTQELDKRSLRLVFSKTAKACSACHDDFRRPKEKDGSS